MPTVHVLAPSAEFLVGERGQRYVARACAAPRDDGNWDGWCIFLPFGHGLPLVTERDTIQSTFAGVKSWADRMTAVDLQHVFQRARACWPDALISSRSPEGRRRQ
jgi:hypothetical protein